MSERHLITAFLSLALLGATPLLAQDGQETVPPEKVEEVVEARAEKERKEEAKKPEGANTGESSYNVSDCEPNWKGEKTGSGDSSDSDQDAIEECENIDK